MLPVVTEFVEKYKLEIRPIFHFNVERIKAHRQKLIKPLFEEKFWGSQSSSENQ